MFWFHVMMASLATFWYKKISGNTGLIVRDQNGGSIIMSDTSSKFITGKLHRKTNILAYFLCTEPWAFIRSCHTTPGNHTLGLEQKVIFSPCCWKIKKNTQHVRVPSDLINSTLWFLLLIASEHVWALGVKHATIFQYGRRQIVNISAGSMEWFRGYFQSMDGSDRKWEVVRGMWLVSLALKWQHGTHGICSAGTVETNYHCNLL